MHPLNSAPPHVLKHLRQVILEGFPLESITKYVEQDWKLGFSAADILDWAALEGIAHVVLGVSPAGSGGVPPPAPPREGATSTSAQASPLHNPQSEINHPQSENSRISKDFKANQTAEASSPDPQFAVRNPQSNVSNQIKPNQSQERPPALPFPPVENPTPPLPSGNNSVRSRKRRRTGKVARLPHAIREHINSMLEDGHPYREIVDWLANNGYPGFNQENISNWAQGGFQDWLNHQDALDHHKILAEYAKQIVAACPGTTFKEACDAIIQMDLYSALNRFDMEGLHQLLKDKPEFWFKLINTMTGFNRAKLAEDKFKWQKSQAEEKGAAREDATPRSAQIPTAPALSIHPVREGVISTCAQTSAPQNASISNDLKPIQTAEASSPDPQSAMRNPQSNVSNQIKPNQSQENPPLPPLPPVTNSSAFNCYFHANSFPTITSGGQPEEGISFVEPLTPSEPIDLEPCSKISSSALSNLAPGGLSPSCRSLLTVSESCASFERFFDNLTRTCPRR